MKSSQEQFKGQTYLLVQQIGHIIGSNPPQYLNNKGRKIHKTQKIRYLWTKIKDDDKKSQYLSGCQR